jgi:Sec-independent protein translocase protein TatA
LGIDLPELLILAVLALILFGPEKLPEYAAKLGKFVARMRQASTEVTKPLQQAMHSETLSPLPPPPPPATFLAEQFCHQCGHTLEPDFLFCPRCGRRLDKAGADKAGGAASELAS